MVFPPGRFGRFDKLSEKFEHWKELLVDLQFQLVFFLKKKNTMDCLPERQVGEKEVIKSRRKKKLYKKGNLLSGCTAGPENRD